MNAISTRDVRKSMNKRLLITILIALFIGVQGWFNYLIFSYPAVGIVVEQGSDKKQIVTSFEIGKYSSLLGIQIGDEVKEINGLDANEYISVIKWASLEQAKTILIHRDGSDFGVSLIKELPRLTRYDFIAFCAQFVCFTVAFLIYRRLSYSLSARYLTFAILNIGFTFMSLGASIRGDVLGKIFMSVFLVFIPFTLLHFLIVFFKEKGGITLLNPLLTALKYFYIVYFALCIANGIFYVYPSLTHYNYPESLPVIIFFFLLGILFNVGLLTYLYFKYRAQRSFVTILVKTVWISLFVSLMPTAIFSFLPLLIFDMHWIDPIYTAWFLILFPLSFTYLIASERIYDLAIIIRRLGLTTALSIIPAGFIAGSMGIIFSMEYKAESIFIIFVFTLIILSILLYSLEYLLTKLEPILFPRKYYLQSSLKQIANSLSSISNFNDLKANILVDIVRTLEVFGGALVFKYKEGIESFTEGAIDVTEVECLIESEQLEHIAYTFYVVSRNEEYTSYLVMTQKKTNTLLGYEDTQWLNLIISYLAVSLENVHLIREMTTIARHRDLLHNVTMNTINDGVIITDINGSIIEINQLIEKIINCRRELVINESVFQFEALAGYMKSVLHSGQRFENIECSFYPSAGKQVNCLLDAFPILNDQEEIIGAYLRIWDISERIEHEKQMLSAEKFSLMGKLAVGIAHEIRNPLTSITGIVQLLREKYVNAETYYRYMNIVHDELINLKNSVSDFVLMAKPSLPLKKEVIVQHIINETVQLMTSQANVNDITLTTNLSSADIILCVDAAQLKQVFMNLLQNAFEATPRGGEVNIGLSTNPESNDVEIRIKDTGKGITQSQINEVFNPFFTTKENGIGVGLGICSRIIENHNGKISVTSNQGTGTVFTIVFPSEQR